jgi:hypothetical protein
MAEQENQKDYLERLSRESMARGFVEYPKMLHHPDGRTQIVNDSQAESELTGNGWCLTPAQALKVRAERDEADKKRDAATIAKAAKDKKGEA